MEKNNSKKEVPELYIINLEFEPFKCGSCNWRRREYFNQKTINPCTCINRDSNFEKIIKEFSLLK